jgi:hypothetical protein
MRTYTEVFRVPEFTSLFAASSAQTAASTISAPNGLMQICGYAAGGVLVTVLSPRGTLLAGAGFG